MRFLRTTVILLSILLTVILAMSLALAEDFSTSSNQTGFSSLVGEVNSPSSLLWFTFMMAGMDSINPCAFYILTFLLSIMIYARDRMRILVVGGIFVFFSGFCYFLFMAAWLNVFQLLSGFKPIVWAVMIFVIVAGALNIKDYFKHEVGPSLGASERKLTRIGRSARRLLEAKSIAGLALSAAVLAFTVNLYELLCTAGFPLIYTSVLSSLGLMPIAYYLYLILYNVIYVLPLLAVVLIFAYTLGRMRLSGMWAKRIKLISGYLMIALALSILIEPWALAILETTLQLLAIPLAASALTIFVYERAVRSRK
ncbi:MAG: hypothetical protein J7L79_04450 [Thaumarchaeota archaeon]|nr:hypothetical protein [Nitrososphaerota archaeon]